MIAPSLFQRKLLVGLVVSVIIFVFIGTLLMKSSHIVTVGKEKEKISRSRFESDAYHSNSKFRGLSEHLSDSASGVKMAATDGDQHQHHHKSGGFDVEAVLKLFISCQKEDDSILLDCYVDAYEELCKLFSLFGTIFSFVSSDVVEKIGILREYRKGENADNYKTIQGMLDFEVEKGTTANKKKPSGARTLLRLHRALEFISALLVQIRDTDNHSKFSSVAAKAYDDTLAKHHPWLVKKAVHLAMYTLPSRADLLKKMSVEDNEEGRQRVSMLVTELNSIYDITQEAYAKDKLLDLP